MDFLMNLWKEEDGQGLAEYGLILALIAVVVIGVLVTLGERIGQIFQQIKDGLDKAPKPTV